MIGNGLLLLLCWLTPTTTAFQTNGAKPPHHTTFQPHRTTHSTTHLSATKSNAGASVQSLLAINRITVDALSSLAPNDEISELTRLRFALAFPDRSAAKKALQETLAYRRGAGRAIVTAARDAVALATAGGGWDNGPVRDAAPNAGRINRYIDPTNIVTVSTDAGDLLYVIRASIIDDRKLMDEVSVEQMTDFFLYVKEVHNLVADARSRATGRMCEVIFANDISGVRKPPDKRFSQALTKSSQQYETLYPALAGPTMILNLPFVLQAFIGLITPLFPKTVRERLVFTKAPVLARQKVLTPLSEAGGRERKAFLEEIQRLLR